MGVNIKGSYSTGAVIGKDIVGGLVGMFMGSGLVETFSQRLPTSYTTSTVTATNPTFNGFAGALIGQAAVAASGRTSFSTVGLPAVLPSVMRHSLGT